MFNEEEIKGIKKVLKYYFKCLGIVSLIIIFFSVFLGGWEFDLILKKYPVLLSTLFFSTGTLGCLVNVVTWGGNSLPEKFNLGLLYITYGLGIFFTILSVL